MPRRKFYSFYVRVAIDRDTMEWTTKFPRSKPCTHLLRYLSLAGFVCGFFSVLNPSVDYAREDKENSEAILVATKVLMFVHAKSGIL